VTARRAVALIGLVVMLGAVGYLLVPFKIGPAKASSTCTAAALMAWPHTHTVSYSALPAWWGGGTPATVSGAQTPPTLPPWATGPTTTIDWAALNSVVATTQPPAQTTTAQVMDACVAPARTRAATGGVVIVLTVAFVLTGLAIVRRTSPPTAV
jgi:hypothetical protein